jgi:hypothetical protein
MWNAVKRNETRVICRGNNFKLLNLDYSNATTDEKIHILDIVLDKNFEIYQNENGNVCVYDKIMEEFITENGEYECNLEVFWNNCITENLLDTLQILASTS